MEADNSDIIAKIMRIARLLHRSHHRSHGMHGPAGDPSRGQGRVMALLKMRPEISQKELSYLLDIRPQSLGELLSKLERAGYIERTASETDRRVMDIRLTEEGAAAAEQRPGPAVPLKSLDAGEQEALAGYLDKVIADLEDELQDCEPEHECGHDHPHPHGHECGRSRPEMERPPHPRHGHGCRGRMRHGMPRSSED